MNIKKLGLGLGAFAAGAAAWTWGANRYGDKVAKALDLGSGADTGSSPDPQAPVTGVTAAAPLGMADAEKASPVGDRNPAAEHVPVDLIADEPVTIATRAPEVFRPDPTAVPTDAEREALRPATGPAPSMVADRGSGFSEAAGAA